MSGRSPPLYFFLFFFLFHLTYSRWTSSLPSCLWTQRIFPSLPGSRLTIFYHDASSALLQLVNQWLNFTYSRSHAFRYEKKNTNPTFGKNRTHDFRTSRCAAYLLDHSGDDTLILITMHSHQSWPNITTVIRSYEYSTTIDKSTIETYRNRGLGKQ